jgi:hypothetical protein
LLEVGDLFLLGLRLAAIKEGNDEAAQKINPNDYIQQMLALHLIEA